MKTVDQIVEKALSRRSFLAGAGAATAATMVGCSDDGTVTFPNMYSDTDIVNFALNLEYLEAEFYLRAATGSGLSAGDIGTNPGSVTGGTQVPQNTLTQSQIDIINELADTEQEHVRALRATLGSAAVDRPAIDLVNSFAAAAAAANTLSLTGTAAPLIPSTFSPYANFDAFAVGVFIFEDVGVTAYNGAAPLISPAGIASGILSAAAGIMAVEAYHAAFARTYLTGNAITQGTTLYPYLGYANRISALRAALGGGNETPLNVPSGTPPYTGTNPTPSSIVAADGNALAYKRSTDQVLHIVYGTFSTTAGSTTPSAGVAGGGFFPQGLNGNIKVTQS